MPITASPRQACQRADPLGTRKTPSSLRARTALRVASDPAWTSTFFTAALRHIGRVAPSDLGGDAIISQGAC